LPWVAGNLPEVPVDAVERKAWLKRQRTRPPNAATRGALVKWYGSQKGAQVQYYEAFEICEYGAQPTDARIRELFPMLR